MEPKINLIKKEQLQTSRWSGGTTTELLIYPENAKYSERNFMWRLSSAKVEVEESDFTHLPNISRIIMILDGKLILEHKDQHKAVLNPFEQDSFMGDWQTKSFGVVTDFNLMMNEGCSGKIEALGVKKDETVTIVLSKSTVDAKQISNVFYSAQGSFSISIQEKDYEVSEGDLISITMMNCGNEYKLTINNKFEQEAKIVQSTIVF